MLSLTKAASSRLPLTFSLCDIFSEGWREPDVKPPGSDHSWVFGCTEIVIETNQMLNSLCPATSASHFTVVNKFIKNNHCWFIDFMSFFLMYRKMSYDTQTKQLTVETVNFVSITTASNQINNKILKISTILKIRCPFYLCTLLKRTYYRKKNPFFYALEFRICYILYMNV